MGVSPIITDGYGTFSGVSLVVTFGYLSGEAPDVVAPMVVHRVFESRDPRHEYGSRAATHEFPATSRRP